MTLRPNYASALRQELAARAQSYAEKRQLPFCLSQGNPPSLCFATDADGCQHGNFLAESYRAIQGNPAWRRRLQKPYTLASSILPRHPEYERWRELDFCGSSDALLMNIFCYPGLRRCHAVMDALQTEDVATPEFGFRARVPIGNGRFDGTEIDLRIGDLLVEAKLTELDFQSKSKMVVNSYCDFEEVFAARNLPQSKSQYCGYQLIRNVLAARHHENRFLLLLDARRPDLLDAWFSVLRTINPHDLRLRCLVMTWQELAIALPLKLRSFLAEKYGING